MPISMKNVLYEARKIAKFIKSWPLHSYFFNIPYAMLGGTHKHFGCILEYDGCLQTKTLV